MWLAPDTRPSAWSHGDHHGAEIIRLCAVASRASSALMPFSRRNEMKRRTKFSSSSLRAGSMMRMPSREMFQLGGDCFDLRARRRAGWARRAGGARNCRARLQARAAPSPSGKTTRFGMPLQFFDDTADETHGVRVAGDEQTATLP